MISQGRKNPPLFVYIASCFEDQVVCFFFPLLLWYHSSTNNLQLCETVHFENNMDSANFSTSCHGGDILRFSVAPQNVFLSCAPHHHRDASCRGNTLPTSHDLLVSARLFFYSTVAGSALCFGPNGTSSAFCLGVELCLTVRFTSSTSLEKVQSLFLYAHIPSISPF